MSETFESVWDAIEDTPGEAQNMRLRSDLMLLLSDHIRASGLNQTDAAHLFGVTQPRISDMMNGKISRFTVDALANMAASAGLRIELKLEAA
jgi:predicted XRE-type DNA-binding protein